MSRTVLALSVTLMLLSAGATQAQSTREVSYTPRAVVHIHAKLRFTTMIILPEQEEILDFVCGEGEAVGNASIQAGTTLELKGLGRRFNGNYYLRKTEHRISPKGGNLDR